MSIQQLDLLARYEYLRDATRRIAHQVMSKLPKHAFTDAGKKLGLLHNGTLVFNSEDETSVLMDFALYDVRIQGMNAFERQLAKNPPADADELRILQGMCKARYSLYIVEALEAGIGLHVRDLLQDDTMLIVDINFSRSASVGLVIASRLVTIDGITFSTGASLPMVELPRSNWEEFKQDFVSQFKRMADRCTNPQEYSDFTAELINSCLKSGASSRVCYAEPDEAIDPDKAPDSMMEQHREWSRPQSKEERAKLNKRCPCGSGRKFKNCCGGQARRS